LQVERAEKNLDPTLSKNEVRLVGIVREDPNLRARGIMITFDPTPRAKTLKC
jgi:hypothetical protein